MCPDLCKHVSEKVISNHYSVYLLSTHFRNRTDTLLTSCEWPSDMDKGMAKKGREIKKHNTNTSFNVM